MRRGFSDVVPHFGFDLAAAVGQGEGEVGLAGFLGLDLLGDDHESGGDDLVFVARAVANVEVLHAMSEYMPSGHESFSNTYEQRSQSSVR